MNTLTPTSTPAHYVHMYSVHTCTYILSIYVHMYVHMSSDVFVKVHACRATHGLGGAGGSVG